MVQVELEHCTLEVPPVLTLDVILECIAPYQVIHRIIASEVADDIIIYLLPLVDDIEYDANKMHNIISALSHSKHVKSLVIRFILQRPHVIPESSRELLISAYGERFAKVVMDVGSNLQMRINHYYLDDEYCIANALAQQQVPGPVNLANSIQLSRKHVLDTFELTWSGISDYDSDTDSSIEESSNSGNNDTQLLYFQINRVGDNIIETAQ